MATHSGRNSQGMKGHGGGKTVGDRHTIPMAGPKTGMSSSTGPTSMGGKSKGKMSKKGGGY